MRCDHLTGFGKVGTNHRQQRRVTIVLQRCGEICPHFVGDEVRDYPRCLFVNKDINQYTTFTEDHFPTWCPL
jgi:hypothetical protein